MKKMAEPKDDLIEQDLSKEILRHLSSAFSVAVDLNRPGDGSDKAHCVTCAGIDEGGNSLIYKLEDLWKRQTRSIRKTYRLEFLNL